VRLATGETLTLDTVVTNAGDEAGAFNASLTVDGAVVATETGDIAADAERTATLSHRFDQPGEYAVAVGERSLTVVVEAPAEPTVRSLSVDPTTVRQGETTTATATVGNDAPVPANGTVVVTRNETVVAREPVRLAPGTTTRLSVGISMPTVGPARVGAGAADPVTVTVAAPTTEASGPGFTIIGALLALVVALARRP